MSNFDRLRGKRAEIIDPSSFSVSAPYTFNVGGFVKVNTGGGTIIMEFGDGSTMTYSATANELIDWVNIKKIIGGTATDVVAIHFT